jgi:pyridoxal phosphate enzyme (YggS family)
VSTAVDPLLARLHEVRAQIDVAATVAGRSPDEVALLLATKTVPAQRIALALADGFTLIGENRVQELTEKYDTLAGTPHATHLIGHLQANKINQVIGRVDCLESLDSIGSARKLDARLAARGLDLDVLIQVNVSAEESKSGVAPERALELLAEVAELPRLSVRGFMTIGLNSADRGAVRAGYRALAGLREAAVASRLPHADLVRELSMGMSGDFADAIAEGATIVRIGSAVFGPRPTP